jgi:hypothetical protein
MSALEQQIFDKIHQLDETQQQRLWEFLQTLEPAPFSWHDWFREVENFQAELRAAYGDQHYFGAQDLLDELREEASWPRSS